MALINLDNDPWITEHNGCERLCREIMSQLAHRGKEQRTSHEFARLSASIRLRLKQYAIEVKQLRQKLDLASKSRAITAEEYERRTRQIELLESKDIQMQEQFHGQLRDSSEIERNSLFNASSSNKSFKDLGSTTWGPSDDEPLIDSTPVHSHKSAQELQLHKQLMLNDQERGLENLSQIISRQRGIAETIGTEVDLHNEIIDDLAEHIERTDMRVVGQTQNIRVIGGKDKTWAYWSVIIILFIGIVVVSLITK